MRVMCTLAGFANCRLVSYLYPARNPDLLKKLQEQRVTAIAMDCIPRQIR